VRTTALLISLVMLFALSFGCGGAGSDPSFSPDPSIGDMLGGDEDEGDGEGGSQGGDASGESRSVEEGDCFEDGFCNVRCASASDCPPGFSCIMNMCTFDCQDDDECGAGGVCNDAGLCEGADAEPMPGCVSDDDCGLGRFCNEQASCEKIPVLLGCRGDADCPYGQYCDDDHSCQVYPGAGVECSDDSDCPGNHHCDADYLCAQECRAHEECAEGQGCDPQGYCTDVGQPARLASFTFNAPGANTDPAGPAVFTSANFRIDMVEIAPAGRQAVLSSPGFRLVGSTGF